MKTMRIDQILCNVCGFDDFDLIENIIFGNKILRCKKCGLTFSYPQPSPEELRKIYSESYFKNTNSHLYGYKNYFSDKNNIVKTFVKRLAKIQKIYPKKGKILDLGCAMGFFLEVAKKEGWEPYGVDFSDYAIQFAKKEFNDMVYGGAFLSVDLPGEYFDVITAWDYIEHTLNPKEELNKIYKLLKKDGLFVMTTPDIKSLPAKIVKDKWMGFKDIEHLYYFFSDTICNLASRNGLKVLKQEYVGKYVSLELFIERLNLYNNFLANILKFTTPRKFQNISFYVNPWDILCFYFKK